MPPPPTTGAQDGAPSAAVNAPTTANAWASPGPARHRLPSPLPPLAVTATAAIIMHAVVRLVLQGTHLITVLTLQCPCGMNSYPYVDILTLRHTITCDRSFSFVVANSNDKHICHVFVLCDGRCQGCYKVTIQHLGISRLARCRRAWRHRYVLFTFVGVTPMSKCACAQSVGCNGLSWADSASAYRF